MSDKVEISGSNSNKPSSEVSPSTIFTTLCLRGIQDVKRRIRGELETMARQVLF